MVLRDKRKITRFLKKAADPKTLSVWDVESTGLKWQLDDRICGVVVKTSDGEKNYIPTLHAIGKNISWDFLRPLVKETLENPAKKITGHGFKFDAHMFRQEGVNLKAQCLDTILGAHIANENEQGQYPYKLENLAMKYVNKGAGDAEKALLDLIGSKDNLWKYRPEEVVAYAEQDVDSTEDLFMNVLGRLREQALTNLWRESTDYLLATIEMERNGVPADQDAVRAAIPEVDKTQAFLRGELQEMTGIPNFNPNSSPQVCKWFQLPSSAKEFLEDLGDPIADLILEYRRGTKVVGSFYNRMIDDADENGYIHPSINLQGTVSGRPSCSGPNLQAIPKEGDAFHVRSKFVAPDGWEFYSVDYSQAELRLLAHYAQPELFVKAYQEGGDIHSLVAEELGLVRDIAKRMNLGVIYGLGKDGLARKAKLPLGKAAGFLEMYHERSPEIRRLYRKCQLVAKKQGYVSMWTGRRRRFVEEWECRKAMSGLIQGGVAEIMRHAICRISKWAIGHPDLKMLLQIHDELLFLGRIGHRKELIPRIVADMENFDFRVPIRTEFKVGKSWGEVKPCIL